MIFLGKPNNKIADLEKQIANLEKKVAELAEQTYSNSNIIACHHKDHKLRICTGHEFNYKTYEYENSDPYVVCKCGYLPDMTIMEYKKRKAKLKRKEAKRLMAEADELDIASEHNNKDVDPPETNY